MRLGRRCPKTRVYADEQETTPITDQVGHSCPAKGVELLSGEAHTHDVRGPRRPIG